MGNLSGMGRNAVLLSVYQWDAVAVPWPAAVSFCGTEQCRSGEDSEILHSLSQHSQTL